MPVKSSGVLFDRAARKLGLHPFPAPVAILSQPYRGRGACLHCGFCEGFGCEVNAKSSTLASVIPEAEKTGKCEIRPLSYVRKIDTGGDGRVNAVIYFDHAGREQRQRAKAVVVCANGSETPRLLLLSKSNRFPDGLANSSGMVGKYLMFDNGTLMCGLFDQPVQRVQERGRHARAARLLRCRSEAGLLRRRRAGFAHGLLSGGVCVDRTATGRACWGAGVEEEIEPILYATHRDSGAPPAWRWKRTVFRLTTGSRMLGLAGNPSHFPESPRRFENRRFPRRATERNSRRSRAARRSGSIHGAPTRPIPAT